MIKPAIIIPAYQPTETLITLVRELRDHDSDCALIIVNDGSNAEYQPIFVKLKAFNVVILEHRRNLGKGAALKTAFRYWLSSGLSHDAPGVITADADGQHIVTDIIKISDTLIKFPKCLVIGTRSFNVNEIPWRSRFGNHLTSWIFNNLLGIKIRDTQSGLRGIPKDLVLLMLDSKTNRYEFELEMLFAAKKRHIPFVEKPVKTIYLNNNVASHFNPFIDSIKIYFAFIRFAFAFILSGCYSRRT